MWGEGRAFSREDGVDAILMSPKKDNGSGKIHGGVPRNRKKNVGKKKDRGGRENKANLFSSLSGG